MADINKIGGIDANDPVYPTDLKKFNEDLGEVYVSYPGLTKLEHFAGLAMQGIMGNERVDDSSYERIAEGAVEVAKSLIKKLNEEEELPIYSEKN